MDPAVAKKKQHNLELKDKLLSVTQENTKLLREIAALKSQQMKLDAETKEASSCNESRKSQASRQASDKMEKAKLLALATRQEQEIELLTMEIKSLKTKCGHVSAADTLRLPCL